MEKSHVQMQFHQISIWKDSNELLQQLMILFWETVDTSRNPPGLQRCNNYPNEDNLELCESHGGTSLLNSARKALTRILMNHLIRLLERGLLTEASVRNKGLLAYLPLDSHKKNVKNSMSTFTFTQNWSAWQYTVKQGTKEFKIKIIDGV